MSLESASLAPDSMYALLFGEAADNEDAEESPDSLLSLLSAAHTAPNAGSTGSVGGGEPEWDFFAGGLISGSLHGGSFVGVRDLKQAKQQKQQGGRFERMAFKLHGSNVMRRRRKRRACEDMAVVSRRVTDNTAPAVVSVSRGRAGGTAVRAAPASLMARGDQLPGA